MKDFRLLDKQSRTSVMIGVVICLAIAVFFCVIKIAVSPKTVSEDNNFYLPEREVYNEEELQIEIQKQKEEVKIVVEDRARIIEDNVNVRSGPSTDYDRLGTAYKGFDFELLGEEGEWVKIKYDDKPAYVFAKYVEIVPMVLNDMGEYEDYVELDNSAVTAGTPKSDSTENDGENESNDSESNTDN